MTSTQLNTTTQLDDGEVAPRGDQDRIYSMITERILALLESGVVPWRKPWKGAGISPMNLRSKKPYRGINVFLLECAPFASPYWLSFKQARELGGAVKKGAKGSPVIFWKWLEKTGADDGNARAVRIPLLRYYTVFNLEQVEGIEAPTSTEPAQHFDPIDAAERIVAGMPNAPRITHNAGAAYYLPSEDLISIPTRELFRQAAEYYSTLFHELGHSTGHASRLARPGIVDPSQFASHAYSKEELVAEFTAAYLCGEAGIEQSTLDNSAAYIASWLKRLRDDRRLVVQAAAQAQKAADLVLGRTFGSAETESADSDAEVVR